MENNTSPLMITPFQNDPFAVIYQAFANLFPGKECVCYWHDEIRPSEDGSTVYGLTDFPDDATAPAVFVSSNLSINNAAEILAHELAHVAVGVEHDHDAVWEKAFDDIYQEYIRIFTE